MCPMVVKCRVPTAAASTAGQRQFTTDSQSDCVRVLGASLRLVAQTRMGESMTTLRQPVDSSARRRLHNCDPPLFLLGGGGGGSGRNGRCCGGRR
uniref:Uncharacterized protein n=1 Tax=Plectus sambesii TaxID=2011161 RepID=A0A914VNY5_9BILA